MITRTFDLERLTAQLQLWDAEMAHLEAKVGRLAPEDGSAHATLQEELARLRQLWGEAEQALHRLEQARDDEWKFLLERTELDLGRLGAAFEQSRARFGE
jgi:prefoldin subunit 5